MKILITGISGYLGSQLANSLIDEHEIAGTIRENSSYKRLNNPDEIRLIDLSEMDWLLKINDFNPDIVINTAALYGRNGEPLSQLVQANVQFPLLILEKIFSNGSGVFINCGTSLPSNVSDYALTKNQFSELAKRYSDRFTGKFVDLKLEHFYGPYDDQTKFTTYVINSCKENNNLKLTAGLQERDFIYIEDLLNAFKCLIKNIDNLVSGESIPIGSGQAITIRKFVETVAKITHYQGKLEFGAIPTRQNELMYSCASLERMNELGWKCEYSLNSAIQYTLDKSY
ncbi:NAD(P)-dependent oxidoreductase [Yersinia nurmii]|uniref:NAD(P)-dependent oxidoreductase n=1 Tax=Yersinia nurmii TaxID=685706 RepID=A0AAW7K9I7_9GAMM|nr:NAD(P)-dependent oxidoreductase [Yersinia nurmii]MDN0087960.1 NAD(P)-dependent oxidoreductase [Yersinia nurmii]